MTESHGPAATMAIAMGAGALVVAVCRRLRIPALLPLLGIGLALGSTGLHLVDGNALGSGLRAFVTIAIGLLIFEGALHLNRDELGRAPRAVWGLLTVGAIATWVLGAASAFLILGFGIPSARSRSGLPQAGWPPGSRNRGSRRRTQHPRPTLRSHRP